ncbi:epoxyqueuosine reductase [Syntrophorhabdus aromaticivorans]|jgi:epoxyqueuosine reductase QueG|uniref:Epoxyqueuosine reductase n=1 Tax=Syntrophorhabdus aromaticivorans TaxID=328301 RepID=A0A351U170_9BACT|nr:epoxyqueuosine reductase [Syntrophorhabdus aromaticivorans]NLW35779.1 epoxyqueuosine reductase [Syntrophorhabdus aromaticivorans]HBA53701.1 epoxyqueuosine reductase [Syntrophorhabdus aromaticivorans]
MDNDTWLKEYCEQEGLDVFGVGRMAEYDKELVGIDSSVKERLPFAISFGLVLSKSVIGTVEDGPNVLYLHHYRQANYRLDMVAYLLSKEIEKKGYQAMPFPASQLVDWRNQKGHICHKRVGEISGLGWIGRNNLLVHPLFGARARYNTVLTDMPLTPHEPLQTGCGECRACIGVCPAGAIKDDRSEFDHMGCFSMITQLKNKRNLGHHICGICIAVCQGQ